VRFVALGVRGSTPAPGREFVRYGGHTSCLAVYADGDRAPQLVLDAGTGLRELPRLLAGAPYRGDIVLSHLHWDHIQGLPFCPALDSPGSRVRLFVPVAGAEDPGAVLGCAMSPPYFPIGPEGLLGSWQFEALRPGPVRAGVTVAPVPHKGGDAYAIRVELDEGVLVYLPDHALHAATDPVRLRAAIDFVQGADVLVHDAQYPAAEADIAQAYGHATIEAVATFADRAEVRTLVLTHHAPGRTDADLDSFAARYAFTPHGRGIEFARQGQTYVVRADELATRPRAGGC